MAVLIDAVAVPLTVGRGRHVTSARMEQVWELDYGRRELLLPALGAWLDVISRDTWTTAVLYVNNVPYTLELYVVIGVDPTQPDARLALARLEQALTTAGGKIRTDITVSDLDAAMRNRRFNMYGINNAISLELAVNSFILPSKADLEAKGYSMVPFGERRRVFLSHQADRKEEIYDLRNMLTARDLPTWMDVYDIDFGENLVGAIEKGMSSSSAVIFWISPGFLGSRFCQHEMRSFISDYVTRDEVLLLAALDAEVSHAQIPEAVARLKYLRLQPGEGAETVAEKFGPVLDKFVKMRG